MGSDWDEIKRLAADFQKIQLTSTLQRLSERNCVEIVTLLAEKGLIDVIYTNDGKEYITPDHLRREIEDELFVQGGRVNLVEISKTLNVDLVKINTVAEKVRDENENIHFTLGQLIDEEYIKRAATEINEKLAQAGELSTSDLTVLFDLPSDFLQHNVIEKYLGKIIRGRQDPGNSRVFYTQSYITRCKSKIRGALLALTRPTSISVILNQIKVPERVFHSLIDEISPPGVVTSKLSGAQYIPHIYAKSQIDWVQSFYKQNGFLEYDSVSQLGISDAKLFIKKQFPSEKLMYLNNCVVGPKITDLTVMSAVNECHATKSYVDLSTILPSIMSQEDMDQLFANLMTPNIQNNFIFLENVVFSTEYLTNLISFCNDMVTLKAKSAVENGSYQQYLAEKQIGLLKAASNEFDIIESKADRKEERRKKAVSGKAGGGAQGRETKTKSTKKHYRGGGEKISHDTEITEASSKRGKLVLELVTLEDIEKIIFNTLEEEGLEYLCSQIAEMYHSNLNQAALLAAQTLHEATPQTNRRQTHAAHQDKLNVLLNDVRLYEKGLKLLPADVQPQLVKYLLKSLGNDICNEIALYIASECNLNVKNATLTVEQRNKICQDCDMEYKSVLTELIRTIGGNSIDEFLIAAENVMKCCSMIMKKIDKKKDKALIVEHKDKLCQQLREANDPAIILHLAMLKIFTSVTNAILHAPGRYVSHILRYLQTHLSLEQSQILMNYHDLVLKFLSTENEVEKLEVLEQLNSLQKDIIDLTLSYEKSTSRAE